MIARGAISSQRHGGYWCDSNACGTQGVQGQNGKAEKHMLDELLRDDSKVSAGLECMVRVSGGIEGGVMTPRTNMQQVVPSNPRMSCRGCSLSNRLFEESLANQNVRSALPLITSWMIRLRSMY